MVQSSKLSVSTKTSFASFENLLLVEISSPNLARKHQVIGMSNMNGTSLPERLVGQVPVETRGRHDGLAVHRNQATMFRGRRRHHNGVLAFRTNSMRLTYVK